MSQYPESSDPLIDLPELPRTRNHAAAVDYSSEAVSRAIFVDELLGRIFCEPIQGASAGHVQKFADAFGADARRALILPHKPVGFLSPWMGLEPLNRVNPASGQKQEPASPETRFLQTMECSQEVALDQVLRRLVDSSENRRLRGALREYVKRTRRKITRLANVAVVKKHSVSFQSREVHFRTTPVKVIHRDHPGRRQATLKSYR